MGVCSTRDALTSGIVTALTLVAGIETQAAHWMSAAARFDAEHGDGTLVSQAAGVETDPVRSIFAGSVGGEPQPIPAEGASISATYGLLQASARVWFRDQPINFSADASAQIYDEILIDGENTGATATIRISAMLTASHNDPLGYFSNEQYAGSGNYASIDLFSSHEEGYGIDEGSSDLPWTGEVQVISSNAVNRLLSVEIPFIIGETVVLNASVGAGAFIGSQRHNDGRSLDWYEGDINQPIEASVSLGRIQIDVFGVVAPVLIEAADGGDGYGFNFTVVPEPTGVVTALGCAMLALRRR